MNRILIVDDKEETLYYLRTLLAGRGFAVESACHGAEALVRARMNPPDLVISDLLMPVMDGYTLLRHWKADARLKEIPFIVYTATYTEEQDEQLALSLGADAFLLKPAEPEDFLTGIREVLANAAASISTQPKYQAGDEKELLKVYSETLIRKLEEKALQLEEANRAFQQDIAERKRIAEALEISEREQRDLAGQLERERSRLVEAQAVAKVGSWETDLATLSLIWSNETFRIFETDAAHFQPTHPGFLQMVHPEDRATVEKAFAQSLDNGVPCSLEHRVLLPDGRIKFVEERWQALRDERGKPTRAIGTCQDITERKRAEEKIQRLNRLYAVSSGINEAIVRIQDTQKLYEQACLIAVEQGGLVMAWVGLVQQESRLLTPVARWGRDEGYLDSIQVRATPDRREGLGPAGQAFRTAVPACCNDIEADAANFASRDEALKRGYRSCAAVPLKLGGRPVGVLVVYCSQPGYFDREELHVLNSLAENISFAIESHENEQQRLQAEEALRRTGDLLQAVADGTSDAVFVKDLDGRYLLFNQAASRFVGRAAAEVIGKDDTALFDAEGAKQVMANDRAVRNSGLTQTNEENLIAAGVPRTFLATKAPYRDALGNIIGTIGISHDITERKRAEERIREQAAMLDRANEAIIVRDIQTLRITFWNRGAERLYGWTAAEAIGRNIGELVFADPSAPKAVSEQLLRTGECHAEHQHLSKSGKKLTVSSHATLMPGSDGHPKSALVINIDITEQKELEARLLRAQRMESIGTLASGVAHDLNNILAPIMMSVPILRRELDEEQREEIISTIETSAERGAQIIKQVLAFGRGLEGEKCPLRAGTLIREMMKIMRGTFPKSLAVECSVESDLWQVIGDATQLHQVLLNLCVNARDAMPGGGRLRLAAQNLDLDSSYASMLPEATPGRYVMIEVSDSGTGIAPEVVERIFDPFFTTKGVGKGTGLGLSTTLGIVKSHGGFIAVNSDLGKGTTFRVYLPASQEIDTPAAGTSREQTPGGRGELILVVDDERSVRDAVRISLETAGYRVLLAADGTEALAMFAMNSESVAAMLTDLMMPLMDGVALIRALRTMSPDLPIIASTGLGEKVQLADLKTMGVKTVLHKPYGADTLMHTLYQTLHPEAVSPAG